MKIIYYYHIPKCGGTSISRLLKESAKATAGKYYDFNSPMQRFGPFRKIMNDVKMRLFLKSLTRNTSEFKFIHHHHGFYGLSEISSILKETKNYVESIGSEFHLFTCVREPISFQKSRINYLRNKGHAPDITFEDAFVSLNNQNIMYKYLLYNHPKRWDNRAPSDDSFETAFSLLDKVFVLERYEDLVNWLEKVSGVSVSSPKKAENVGKYELLPTPEQINQLMSVNNLDTAFYNKALTQTEEP